MKKIGAGQQPLVGRITELALYGEALADPGGRGFSIHGPQGVGKSRLADECLHIGASKGWNTVRATATQGASAVPFGALAHIIPAGTTTADVTGVFTGIASEIEGGKKKETLFLVEDIPLLDQSSLIILQRLSDAGKIFLLSTARDGQPAPQDARSLTTGFGFRQVNLKNLDQEGTHHLLESMLDGPVSRRTSYEIYLKSAGNPLFLRELVIAALDARTMHNDGEVWELAPAAQPETTTPHLAELVETRLSALSPPARTLLEAISLCGTITPDSLLSETERDEALLELEAEDLAHVFLDRRRTRIDLTHPVYGEVLQANMPPFKRRRLYLNQAQALTAHGLRRRGDFFRSVAWQVEATGTAETGQLLAAARIAQDTHSYDRAVQLLEAVPQEETDTACLLLLGHCLAQAGRTDEVEAVLVQAQKLAQGDDEILDVAFTRVQNLFWVQGHQAEALQVIEQAARHAHSPSAKFRIRSAEATIRIACGDPQAGLDALGEITYETDNPADVNVLLLSLMYKSPGLTMTGRTAEAVTTAQTAYDVHLRHHDQALYLHPAAQRNGLVFALAEAGRLDEARTVGNQALTELMAARAHVPHVWTALQLARAEWLAGHPRSARHWYAEAIALGRPLGQTLAMRPALCGLAAAAAQIDDDDAAEKALAEAHQYPRVGLFVGEDDLATAWLHAAAGRLEAAREVLVEAALLARDAGVVSSEAALLTDVARLGGPRQVLERITHLARTSDSPFTHARAAYVTELATGDAKALEAVSRSFEEMGADLLAAEASAAAAAGWKRAGETRKATAAANRTDLLAARCEGARTPLLSTAPEPAAALTPRERDIALLTSSGASAQEVADALSISRRTVENHLYNIYGKLGVSTRAELKKALNPKT
ncbi:LuxR C-terminal-related transcriptional regulator [Streptomyces sp. NPDC056738]|uniref:LuxR C-terminal-related transcriptional regulator n=1 Tax=Streptomyces sp. NPDC056738 TaxID=3345933 RepID=UPI0036CEA378